MKNFSMPILSNSICLTIISFIIAFLVLNYFLEIQFSLVLSTFFTFIIITFYIMFATAKKNKVQKEKNKNRDLEQVFIELNFDTKQEIISRFTKAFEKQNKTVKKLTNSILIKEDNLIIYFAFGFDGVLKQDIIKAYSLITKGEIVKIYCSNYSDEIEKFIKRFNASIQIEDKKEIFSLLEKGDLLPAPTHILQDENHKKKASFKNFFQRKRAKSFLTFGLTLSFMSMFVRYKIYYLICGISFLAFFLISFFFGKREVKN